MEEMNGRPARSDVSGNPGWMLSGAVAKRLGVKTSTLKKWRSLGKGPQVWRRAGQTVVVYLVSSVIEFERTWGHDVDVVN